MKRIVSIAFLTAFLLNVLGYYGIFMGLRHKMVGQIKENLNESNYALSDEITFKVPMALPYASDMKEYERVDGEFKHEQNTYRLVKQKLFKDTLYIVCVKDSHLQKIDKALEDYVKTFSDKPSSEKSGTKTILTFSKDFISQSISLESIHEGWELAFVKHLSDLNGTSTFCSEIIQPPKI
jgi:hypothetical protein